MSTVAPDQSVADLVTRDVLVVGMDQPVVEVRAALSRRGSRFAAVRQGTRITAVVDGVSLDERHASGRADVLVRHVVHPGGVCLRADATATRAASIMRRLGSAALPVVDDHHALLGLVTAEAVAASRRG